VLYYCLSGRYPFGDGTAVEKMMAHQFKPPTPIREVAPGIPDGLATVIDRLLQKAPDARYGDVDELVTALQPYVVMQSRPGSRFGNQTSTRSGGSAHGGSRLPTAPVPRPQPTASAQVPTPQTGPLTPVPATPIPTSDVGFSSRAGASHAGTSHSGASHSGASHSGASHVFGPEAETTRPVRRPIPASRPNPVTRANVLGRIPSAPASQSQVPTAVEAVVPVGLPAGGDDNVPFAEPAGRVTNLDAYRPGGMSFLVKFMIFLTVVISVFIVGKTYLFHS
jgi:hypothetical protein